MLLEITFETNSELKIVTFNTKNVVSTVIITGDDQLINVGFIGGGSVTISTCKLIGIKCDKDEVKIHDNYDCQEAAAIIVDMIWSGSYPLDIGE